MLDMSDASTTKVTRTSGAAKFPTGGSVGFTISRSGERLAVALSNDRSALERQTRAIEAWLRPRSGETNGQRMDRLANVCGRVASGADLVAAIGATS